jgi:hypothetical protein
VKKRFLLLLPVAGVVLTGCGSPAAAPAPAAAATSAAPGPAAPRAARGPAASGEIAAVTGHTLQVQNSSAQTAVTWSAATAFTKSVPARLAVGDCVSVTGTPGTGSALTATAVRVVSTGGTCAEPRRTRPSGAPSGAPPSGFPTDRPRPSGAPDRQQFAMAYGTVTAVSGGTATVTGTLRSGGRFGGATPAATPSAGPIAVTLPAAARVTAEATATGADATVGTCATATGKADSTGTVAATAIALSPKGTTGCGAGFGRFPGGGFGG